jgi:hypothetical protein
LFLYCILVDFGNGFLMFMDCIYYLKWVIFGCWICIFIHLLCILYSFVYVDLWYFCVGFVYTLLIHLCEIWWVGLYLSDCIYRYVFGLNWWNLWFWVRWFSDVFWIWILFLGIFSWLNFGWTCMNFDKFCVIFTFCFECYLWVELGLMASRYLVVWMSEMHQLWGFVGSGLLVKM